MSRNAIIKSRWQALTADTCSPPGMLNGAINWPLFSALVVATTGMGRGIFL